MDSSVPLRSVPAAADYRRLLELVQAVVWCADPRTFQTTFASPEAEEIMGYPAEAWTNEPDFWVRHLHPDDRDRVLELTKDAVSEGRTHDFEYRLIGANGDTVWLRNIVTVVMVNGEPSELVGITVRIGERKRAEFEAAQLRRQLTQVTRVAALGELSALLAHELNQPLGAIVANAEAALMHLKERRADAVMLAEILEDIRRDAARSGAVVHSLRRLLQRGAGRRRPVDLARITSDVLSVLRGLLVSRGIDVTLDLAPGGLVVEGDGTQLQEVILNLVVNAVDAMEDVDAPHRLRIWGRASGGNAEVHVSDSGGGISPLVLPRLFEPLVTTKTNGTGVGLSLCRRIIESHGGEITGTNNPDRGATFMIRLKASANPVAGVAS